MLANLSVNVVDPQRGWPLGITPFDHQQDAYHFGLGVLNLNAVLPQMRKNGQGVALLMEMGTGKTLTAIALASRAFLDRKIGRVLVVCPNAVIDVWPDEFKFAMCKHPVEVRVLVGSNAEEKISLLRGWPKNPDVLQVVVINYESAWRVDYALKWWNPEMIISDESQRIASPSTKQSKFLHYFGTKPVYRLALTGTPRRTDEQDIYSIYKYVDPNIFGTSITKFRDDYLTMHPLLKNKVLALRNGAEFTTKMHSIAFRVTKEQAKLNLPETLDVSKFCQLEPAAQKIYNDLVRESVSEFDDSIVSAPNILTRLMRLQQITGGFLADDDGKITRVSQAKLQLLDEMLDDLMYENKAKKVVIFARFREELQAIKRMLDEKGYNYVGIDGLTPQSERGGQVKLFQTHPNYRVFVGQPAASGLGITLTAADVEIFYSTDFSFVNYEQARARIHRIGQKNACTYIHLAARGTVDMRVLQSLRDKKSMSDDIIDNWRTVFLGKAS